LATSCCWPSNENLPILVLIKTLLHPESRVVAAPANGRKQIISRTGRAYLVKDSVRLHGFRPFEELIQHTNNYFCDSHFAVILIERLTNQKMSVQIYSSLTEKTRDRFTARTFFS
jgi:hypothetical protein